MMPHKDKIENLPYRINRLSPALRTKLNEESAKLPAPRKPADFSALDRTKGNPSGNSETKRKALLDMLGKLGK